MFGFNLCLISIFCLVTGIVDTVKYANIIDYHSITPETIKTGNMVQGTIDEWYGPFAYTTDGAEIYFLLLDNDQIIAYSTYDEDQIAIFAAYDETLAENEEVEFTGKIKKMPKEDKDMMLEILVDEGFTLKESEEMFIPYYVANQVNITKYLYLTFVVAGFLGFAMFLPEFSELMGRSGARKEAFEPTYYTSNANTGYQTTYSAGTQKTYTGVTNVNNSTGTSAQTFGQNQYGQQTTQGQNRQYTGSQPVGQGQNREYTGSQYTTQGQNREYAGSQYTTQGQNREYTGSQYTTQGQNREYTGSQYTTQGQNRQYTGSQYTAQGQNREYTDNQYTTDAKNEIE
ncbi:MAG: hypothetical protein UHK60_12895 [Acutalibacteraceae bacterium]|nr:hypothetical protein [Acutalibacteraceae bacterium]